EASGSGLKGEREWVAQTHRPNRAVRTGSRAGDSRKRCGIIRRNGAVGIDAQNFAQAIAQRLRVCAVRILTDAGVKLAIRPEMDGTAIVVGGATQVVEVDQNELAAGHGDIAVRRKPAYAIMRR